MIDLDATVLAACTATFGEAATYQPANGLPVPCTVVFTERATISRDKLNPEVVEEVTTLGARVSELGQIPARGDQFAVRGVQWRVAESVPDGHGHVRISISLANNAQANLPLTRAFG